MDLNSWPLVHEASNITTTLSNPFNQMMIKNNLYFCFCNRSFKKNNTNIEKIVKTVNLNEIYKNDSTIATYVCKQIHTLPSATIAQKARASYQLVHFNRKVPGSNPANSPMTTQVDYRKKMTHGHERTYNKWQTDSRSERRWKSRDKRNREGRDLNKWPLYFK